MRSIVKDVITVSVDIIYETHVSCDITRGRRNMAWNIFHDKRIGRMQRKVSISMLCTQHH